MKKPILIALLCASLMLVTPFCVVARENTITSNLSEQPDIERLFAQLRVVINKILAVYGKIPMVVNLCGVVINIINSYEKLLICFFLFSIYISLELLFLILSLFGFGNYILLSLIFSIGVYLVSNCNPIINDSPLKTISTLTGEINEFELTRKCPCL